MEIETVKKFNEELLSLTLRDLRNMDLIGNLEEVRITLGDIFSMFKMKVRPIVFKKDTSQTTENKSKGKPKDYEKFL